MPQRRGHEHARRVGGPVAAPVVERRVVTVYTTLTSSGWTGGLTTIYPSSTTTKVTTDTKTTTTDDLEAESASSSSSSSTSLPDAIEASTASSAAATGTLVAATENPTTSSTKASSTISRSASATAAEQTSSASATSIASSSDSGSTDVATKAGIALGVLGGLLVVLGLVYFFITRRRKQMEEDQQRHAADDEKLNGPFADSFAAATPARAPRLSLRPVTGLFTSFSASAPGEPRAAKPPALGLRPPGASAWERPMTSESQNDQNPFGSGARRIAEEPSTPQNPMSPMTPISEASTHGASPDRVAGLTPAPRAFPADSATVPAIMTKSLPPAPAQSDDVSPAGSSDHAPVGQAITTPEPVQTATFAGPAVAAAASLAVMERRPSERRQSVRKENVPAPLDLTLPPKFGVVPPSPAGTEFSMQEVDPTQSPIASNSAAAIAAAGGPANSTVHRVQLDFRPTLDDEMGLQAGQLVRLLHEYDDGWALCIRLDRSQQGVVPRTCLSTRPVKPRSPPQGRPRGPSTSSQRGPGPNYPPGGQNQRRPGPPAGPGVRPPNMGPGPGPRPQSPSGPGRKPSPPGPSNRQQEYRPSLEGPKQGPITRKPAPGQAY